MNYFGLSKSYDAWKNLAQDEYLLNTLGKGDLALFFYINESAVIIGRNQNAWAECDLHAMARDGVQLTRRCSGGGAVYHDRGNLNFSFICHKDRYDEQAQSELILRALQVLGIQAQLTGRNDISCDGRKFSGNAFCTRGENKQRHGTLLIRTDMTAMGRYLNVSAAKLRAKGVASVRARVCNLTELQPELTLLGAYEAIQLAFLQEFGDYAPISTLLETPGARQEIDRLAQRHASWAWRLGESPKFDYQLSDRFSFGMLELDLSIAGGSISQVQVYTDSLDLSLPQTLQTALLHCRFDRADMAQALQNAGQTELAAYLTDHELTA